MRAIFLSIIILGISGLLVAGYVFKSNLKPPLFTIQTFPPEETKQTTQKKYPDWVNYKSNYPSSFGDNYITYDNGRGLSFKAPKEIKLRGCDSKVPSKIKIVEDNKNSMINVYTENPSSDNQNCSDESIRFYFSEYKGKRELEKIIQKHFGENCKITGFNVDKIKNIKYPIFDKSYEQLPEFKEKGNFSGLTCEVGWQNGYNLSVNQNENVVFWIDSPMQAAKFIDVNDKNKTLDIYQDLILQSIVLK